MSILIKGMKMPDGCYNCPFFRIVSAQKTITAIPLIQYTKAFCLALKTEFLSETNIAVRPSDCPLTEVPPHGRLIDADALEKCGEIVKQDQGYYYVKGVAQTSIYNAPTIIEEER